MTGKYKHVWITNHVIVCNKYVCHVIICRKICLNNHVIISGKLINVWIIMWLSRGQTGFFSSFFLTHIALNEGIFKSFTSQRNLKYFNLLLSFTIQDRLLEFIGKLYFWLHRLLVTSIPLVCHRRQLPWIRIWILWFLIRA